MRQRPERTARAHAGVQIALISGGEPFTMSASRGKCSAPCLASAASFQGAARPLPRRPGPVQSRLSRPQTPPGNPASMCPSRSAQARRKLVSEYAFLRVPDTRSCSQRRALRQDECEARFLARLAVELASNTASQSCWAMPMPVSLTATSGAPSTTRAQRNFADIGHELDRVGQQVDDDLLELALSTPGAVTLMPASAGAWPPSDALVEIVGWLGVELRAILALPIEKLAPCCNDT
jgi:hypothetical protein